MLHARFQSAFEKADGTLREWQDNYICEDLVRAQEISGGHLPPDPIKPTQKEIADFVATFIVKVLGPGIAGDAIRTQAILQLVNAECRQPQNLGKLLAVALGDAALTVGGP